MDEVILKKVLKVFHKDIVKAHRKMMNEGRKRDNAFFKGSQWKESDIIKIRKPHARKKSKATAQNSKAGSKKDRVQR